MIRCRAMLSRQLATGHTDMRKGFARAVAASAGDAAARSAERAPVLLPRPQQQSVEGDLATVRGLACSPKAAGTRAVLWASPADGAITISPAQLGYLLSGIDWRHPQETWRPTSVGRLCLADHAGCDSIV